jgi:hypothetical protein
MERKWLYLSVPVFFVLLFAAFWLFGHLRSGGASQELQERPSAAENSSGESPVNGFVSVNVDPTHQSASVSAARVSLVRQSLGPHEGEQLQTVRPVLAFDEDKSIIETIEAAASAENWRVRQIADSLVLWRGVCGQSDGRESIGYLDGNEELREQVRKTRMQFCAGYSDEVLEGYFLLAGQEEDVEDAIDPYSPFNFQDSAEVQSSDFLLDQAVRDINSRLTAYDFAGVLQVLGAITHTDLLDPPIPGEPNSDYFVDGYVVYGLASVLFCQEIGGCNGFHPVTQSICSQIPMHKCYDPVDEWDAFLQTRSGLQSLALVSLYNQIAPRIARARSRD